MDLSIVVPIYTSDRIGDLATCVASVRQNTTIRNGSRYELILVNDASPNQSLPLFLRSLEPDILMELAVNRGFAGACNLGAGASRGQIVTFLNSDAAVWPGWNTPIEDAFKDKPDVAMIGASSKRQSDQEFTDHGWELYDGRIRPVQIGPLSEENLVPVLCPPGACMCVSRSKFFEVGGFDELFQNSCEDLDLCARFIKRGDEVYVSREAKVNHLYEASRHNNPRTNLIASRVRFDEKHVGFAQIGDGPV